MHAYEPVPEGASQNGTFGVEIQTGNCLFLSLMVITVSEVHVCGHEETFPWTCVQKMMIKYIIVKESNLTVDTVFSITVQMHCTQENISSLPTLVLPKSNI